MGAIGFYIFYSINWVITLLPLRVLYLFSNFLFVLFYYFPGYRKKVVSENLNKAFRRKARRNALPSAGVFTAISVTLSLRY